MLVRKFPILSSKIDGKNPGENSARQSQDLFQNQHPSLQSFFLGQAREKICDRTRSTA